MTRKAIERLLPHIPAAAPYFSNLPSLCSDEVSPDRQIELAAHALHDARFGWHFVVGYHRLGVQLPEAATAQPWLTLAYHALRTGFTPEVLSACQSLETSDQRLTRAVLKCLLLEGQRTPAEADQWLKLPLGTAQAYNDLFFNVRDRLDEEIYLTHLIWPEGRRSELHQTYLQSEDQETLMLRVTRDHGLQSALKLAGFASLEKLDGVTGASRLESALMTNAVQLAEWGGLNQSRPLPGLSHAKGVLIAVRGSGDNQGDADRLAPQHMNLYDNAIEEIQKHCSIDSPPWPDMTVELEDLHAANAFVLANHKASKEKRSKSAQVINV